MSSIAETPLRVGLIGCGNVALGDHVPAYLAMPDRYRLVAIADPTPERLELGGVASGLGPDDRHADAAALLARSDLDLIDVCTPQNFHRDLVIAAASERTSCPVREAAGDDAARCVGDGRGGAGGGHGRWRSCTTTCSSTRWSGRSS